ncbi:MAG: Holliday junction resolvase RuvX [Anaerolineae bacterium]|nr:Holliday junction resolvase RuvX [Phycisphaerae bacterium]
MRTLAIDLGTKRIGLALSDSGGTIATPHDILQVTSSEQAIAPILKLIRDEDVKRIVIGLPLNMDGTIGSQSRQAIEWAKSLPGEIIFVDERLSSFDAEQRLIDRKRGGEKITRKSKKEMLDALVAAALLQEFLDGKLPPIDLHE